MKISSKRFELNNDIIFSHLSTYPCLFNETNLKTWWRSLLIFKIYSRMSGTTSPEQIGFAVLPLRNIFKSDYLHFEQDLNVIDRTQINTNKKFPNKVAKKFCIGQLHLMFELDSDQKDFKIELDRIQHIEQIKPKKQRVSKSKKLISNPKIFLTNQSSVEVTDGIVVQIYLSIVEARNISQISNNSIKRIVFLFFLLERFIYFFNLDNIYFVCRAFWNEEPITSVVCWGNSTPKFNFEQVGNVIYNINLNKKLISRKFHYYSQNLLSKKCIKILL
jgi:hypothetical protein